uniref:NAC domain-containing protein n=1 Tax=Panagrolaimus sp. JU765 TaxID=591449 RepID=A0AC34RFL7_9BILA
MRHLPYYNSFDAKDPGRGGHFFALTDHPLLSHDVVYNRSGSNSRDTFGVQHAWGNGGRATKAAKKGAPKKKGGKKWFCCFKWKTTKGKDSYDSGDEW